MTVKYKLLALAGAGLVGALLISGVGFYVQDRAATERAKQAVVETALRNHVDGDMMHDAIRADVLAAILGARNDDPEAIRDAQEELEVHAARFRRNLRENASLPLEPEVAKRVSDVTPALENYIASGQAITRLALDSPAEVEHRLPTFLQAFGELEDVGEVLSTELETVADSTHGRLAAIEARSRRLQIGALVGFGLFHPVGFAMVAHGSGPEELGRRMGGFTAVGDIGRVGVAACVTLLVALAGWRRTALAYGCVPAVLALGLYAASRGSPARSGPEESGGKARGLRRNRRFLLATASGFIDALASSSLFVFIPFLYIHRGASTALLGSLSGAFFVGNMLGKVVLGRIADRLGSRKVFVLSELLMAGLLVALGAAKSLPALVVVSVLLGAVTKGTVPVLNTIIAASVPDRRLFDKAFGAGAFANGVAAAAAPLLFGWVIDERGIVAVFGVCAAFAVAAVVPVAVGALLERRAAA